MMPSVWDAVPDMKKIYDSNDENLTFPRANIDITGISQSFTDLLIRGEFRSTAPALNAEDLYMYANNDTVPGNYDGEYHWFAPVTTNNINAPYIGLTVAAAAGNANALASNDIFIPRYSEADYEKTARSFTHMAHTDGAGMQGDYRVWHWRNDVAINRLMFVPNGGGQIATKTRIRIYGIN